MSIVSGIFLVQNAVNLHPCAWLFELAFESNKKKMNVDNFRTSVNLHVRLTARKEVNL